MTSHKMLSPNTRIDWYPASGFANPAAPTVAELNAGTNISGAIKTGFKLQFKDSDVDNSRTIVDEGNVDTPTVANYEGQLTFYRDPQGGASTVFTTAVGLFKGGPVQGYLVSRHGAKSSVAYAAGDVYSLYQFESDWPRVEDGDSKAPITVSVEFIPQGFAVPNKVAA
ncbi:MAG: hypothetical protein ACTHJ9_04465 [Rhodanobacter sp.]